MSIFTGHPNIWLTVLIMVIILVAIVIERKKVSRVARDQNIKRNELLASLQKLSPQEFRKYVADFLPNLGFTEIKIIDADPNSLRDIEAIKKNVKHYIQCTQYMNTPVPEEAVRKFYDEVSFTSHDNNYFITLNEFTREAWKFADAKMNLLDKYDFADLVLGEKIDDFN